MILKLFAFTKKNWLRVCKAFTSIRMLENPLRQGNPTVIHPERLSVKYDSLACKKHG